MKDEAQEDGQGQEAEDPSEAREPHLHEGQGHQHGQSAHGRGGHPGKRGPHGQPHPQPEEQESGGHAEQAGGAQGDHPILPTATRLAIYK